MSNKLEIKLSSEIMNKVNEGHLKTSDLITFILDTTPGATTSKAINETALKDIDFNGQYVVNANIDKYKEILVLELSETTKVLNKYTQTETKNNYSLLIPLGELNGRKVRKNRKTKALVKIINHIESLDLNSYKDENEEIKDLKIMIDNLEFKINVEYWMYGFSTKDNSKVKHYFPKPIVTVYYKSYGNYEALQDFCLTA